MASLGKVLGQFSKASSTSAPSGPRSFTYQAISTNGQRMKGKMQAPSSTAVSEALQADGWIPLKIDEVSTSGLNTDIFSAMGARDLRLNAAELAAFARQLSELLRVGVPLGSALQSLSEDATAGMQAVCADLIESVTSGVPLSEALRAHPKAFDEVFCAYVAAGEAAGALPKSMGRLAATLERRAAMQMKLKGVTAYPKMVGSAVLLVVTAILIFMVPMFTKIYDDFDQPLPAPTLLVVGFTNNISPLTWSQSLTSFTPWLMLPEVALDIGGILIRVLLCVGLWMLLERRRIRKNKGLTVVSLVLRVILMAFVFLFTYDFKINLTSVLAWGVIASIAAVPVIYVRAQRDNPQRAGLIDKMKFNMPVFGRIMHLTCLYRWCTTLAGGLESGVSVGQSLEVSAKASGSKWVMAVTPELQTAVRSGRPLSEALTDYKDLFPAQVRAMVTTGEAAGDLPTMLDNVAATIDGEVDSMVAGLSSRLEVILLLVMGVVVGGLVAVLYLPILNLASAASNMG